MKRLAVAVRVAVVAAFAAQAPLAGAAFPDRPIELIVPFAPGGGSGITGELMKKIVTDEKLSPQPLTITYKPGASGQVGWTYLATRKKDGGYSIATATASFNTAFILGKQLQVTPKDFSPIALMLMDTALIVTQPSSKFKSMKDVIAAATKSPDSVRVSGTGATGGDAIATALINQALKIKLNYIPFQSGGEAAAAILGGHVEVAISNPNELVPHIDAQKLVQAPSGRRRNTQVMRADPTAPTLQQRADPALETQVALPIILAPHFQPREQPRNTGATQLVHQPKRRHREKRKRMDVEQIEAFQVVTSQLRQHAPRKP